MEARQGQRGLTPRQQENIDYFYHVAAAIRFFQVSSWSYKRFENLKFAALWCKDHKCMSMHAYSPNYTDRLRISTGGTLSVYFESENAKWQPNQPRARCS
jgi:hypothetical protein